MDWLISLAHWFGSAVCHQWPAHSYFIAGIELPLCARCTGLYLGALLTLGFHSWRHPRAVGMPRPWVLVTLVLFFFAWAGDGVNSFADYLRIVPPLYPPQNILRLATGALMGITLGTLVFVMFNSLVWRRVSPEAVLATPREFLALLVLMAVLVAAVASQWEWFLYPLQFVGLAAILILNGGLMSAMAANMMARASDNWREALPVMVVGALIALGYLDAFALGRLALGNWLGVPL